MCLVGVKNQSPTVQISIQISIPAVKLPLSTTKNCTADNIFAIQLIINRTFKINIINYFEILLLWGDNCWHLHLGQQRALLCSPCTSLWTCLHLRNLAASFWKWLRPRVNLLQWKLQKHKFNKCLRNFKSLHNSYLINLRQS